MSAAELPVPVSLSVPNQSWPASLFWKFCCFWPRSSGEAELHAVRAEQLGQLVAELQRVVVRVDVVGRRPQVADLAAAAPPVQQVVGRYGLVVPAGKMPLKVMPPAPCVMHARILEVVVERQPAVADERLVGHRRAQHRDDVAGVRPADVLADVRRRQRDVRRSPPHAARALGRLGLVRDAHVGLGAVADVPVEPRLEVGAVGRLEPAVDVVVKIVRVVVVRQRIQAGEVLARSPIMYGRMSLFGAGWPASGKPCGNLQLRDAVQVRAAVAPAAR